MTIEHDPARAPPRRSRLFALFRWLTSMAAVRVLLILSVLGTSYLLVGAVFLAPWLCLLTLAFYVWWRSRRQEPLTTHGSAHWADARDDLLPAGMLDGNTGLIVGQVPAPKPKIREVLGALVDWRVSADDTCRLCARLLTKKQPLATVRLAHACHVMVVGPPGSGKSTGIAVPHLAACSDSMIVVDMKGELFGASAEHRRTVFRHHVVCIDPFGVCSQSGIPPDTLNVLDLIDPLAPLALDQIDALAKAMVIRTGEEKEPHWNDSAEVFIAGLIAGVIVLMPPEMRSLQTVRQVFVDADQRKALINAMCESDAFEGLLARRGMQLRYYLGDEQASVLTTVGRHLRFLDTHAIAASTEASSFNPSALNRRGMTCFIVLPPEFTSSHAGWLRLCLTALVQFVVRSGLQEKNLVHVLVDEAGVLKRFQVIDDVLNRLRAYGLRLVLLYQSVAQIKECWGEMEGVVMAATTQIFIGVNDLATAELVSASTGDTTILVRSAGGNGGGSRQKSSHDHTGSYAQSWGWSDNLAPTGRRLITAAEVMRLSSRVALIFCSSVPVICTYLRRSYDPPTRPEGRWTMVACRFWAVLMFALVAGCGVRLTEALTTPRTPPAPRAVITGDRNGKTTSKVREGDRRRVEKAGDARQR